MIGENELIQLIIKGDKVAFAELFERHYGRLSRFIFRITKSKETAEEVVLDIFLKIWISRETLSEVKNFNTYLFVLSKNAAISALRKASREKARAKQWKSDTAIHTESPDTVEKEPYLNLIDEAIRQLSPQRQKVYLLSREKGLTYQEIAHQLGLSKLTVRTHIQQAVHFITNYVLARTGGKLSLIFILFLIF